MKDRKDINDSDFYRENGIIKREILKANSSGSSGTSHDYRTSFFYSSLPPLFFKRSKNRQPVLFFVAEPVEINIFRIPDDLNSQQESYQNAATIPPFFNST